MSVGQHPEKLKVFISYSRQDIAFVDRLQECLAARDIEAFVDRGHIEKGEEWWARIQQLVTEADTIVFVLSPGSVASSVCQEEVSFAEKLNKRFVPIVARDLDAHKVPDALARLNYIFFIPHPATGATGDFESTVDVLVRALETDIAWIREHTRLGALALRWEERKRPRDLLLRGAELSASETWLTSRPAKAPDPTDVHRSYLTESRRAAIRRQRWVVGLSMMAAVVALVLAGIAVWQAGEARRQTAAAEANLHEAQRTQSRQLSEAARVISDQPDNRDATLAMLLALEGMPDTTSDDPLQAKRPRVEEAQFQLDGAYRANRERIVLVHDGWVRAVAWSPDGRFLATGSQDDTARIVDAVTGKEIVRLVHDNSVTAVAWSPDARYLATGSEDTTARIVEAATGKEVARVDHDGMVRTVAWSPDGRHLATGSGGVEGGEARIVEAATGKEIARVDHDSDVDAVAWSPDGRHLATGSQDNTARIVEAVTGKEVARVVHDDDVSAVAWSPDGRHLATARRRLVDKAEARIVEVATGREVARVVHEDDVSAVAWSPDGWHLATGSEDNTARIVDAMTGKEVARVAHDGVVRAVAWSPDGRRLATGSTKVTLSGNIHRREGKARIIEVATRKEIVWAVHDDYVNVVAWSPDGRHLATGSDDTTTRIVDVATGKETSRVNHYGVSTVTWSPDGRCLATGSYDKTARIVEVATGKEIAHVDHDGVVNTVTWSPDSRHLATGSGDKTVRIVEVATGKEIAHVAHDSEVHAVAWSPDGRHLAIGSGNDNDHNGKKGEARIVDAATGKEVAQVHHDSVVNAVAWSPDGRHLAIGSTTTGLVQIVEIATGHGIARLAQAHDGGVYAVAWSPDGRHLATGASDRTAQIAEVATGKEIARAAHDHTVAAVAWSPDGRHLATGSWDKTARIIEVATGREIARLLHDDWVT